MIAQQCPCSKYNCNATKQIFLIIYTMHAHSAYLYKWDVGLYTHWLLQRDRLRRTPNRGGKWRPPLEGQGRPTGLSRLGLSTSRSVILVWYNSVDWGQSWGDDTGWLGDTGAWWWLGSWDVWMELIEHNIHTFILHTTSGLPYISWHTVHIMVNMSSADYAQNLCITSDTAVWRCQSTLGQTPNQIYTHNYFKYSVHTKVTNITTWWPHIYPHQRLCNRDSNCDNNTGNIITLSQLTQYTTGRPCHTLPLAQLLQIH